MNKTSKARAELIATTRRMQCASQLLERSRKTRKQIISEALKTECVVKKSIGSGVLKAFSETIKYINAFSLAL